jgi:hypothetical protein
MLWRASARRRRLDARCCRLQRLAVRCSGAVGPGTSELLGVWFFQEPFGGPRQLAFGLIWIALALSTGEVLWSFRERVPTVSSRTVAGE